MEIKQLIGKSHILAFRHFCFHSLHLKAPLDSTSGGIFGNVGLDACGRFNRLASNGGMIRFRKLECDQSPINPCVGTADRGKEHISGTSNCPRNVCNFPRVFIPARELFPASCVASYPTHFREGEPLP